MAITKIPPARTLKWIRSGFAMIFDEPAIWIGGCTASIVAFVVLSFIPFVGEILVQVLQFGLILFALAFADTQRLGRKFDFDAYFKPLSPLLPKLIGITLLNFLLLALAVAPLFMSIHVSGGLENFGSLIKNFGRSSPHFAILLSSGLLSALLLTLCTAASAYSIPLIFFQGLSIPEAMKTSALGSLKNVLTLFTNGLLLMLILLLGTIPLFLGWIVVLPLFFTSYYRSYYEIFERDPDKNLA